MNLYLIIRDKMFWAAIMCGPVFWWWLDKFALPHQPLSRLQGEVAAIVLVILVYPVLEEIIFRGGLQTWLSERTAKTSWYGISLANILTSLVFASAHLLYHPTVWAASVFIPSMVFGFFRDRHQSLISPIVLHSLYNSGFALLFMTF